MDIFGALLDIGIGAAIAGFFIRSKYPISYQITGIKFTAYAGMAVAFFLPSAAFIIMGQLLVTLFFEIPQLEARIKDESNG